MSKSLNITTKNLWKFYVKLSDFEAQCLFCENKYCYVESTSFKIHIARHHTNIWICEKERKYMQLPWRYYKYVDDVYSQCIICDVNVLSTTESLENHLNLHSLQQLEDNMYRGWSWRYYTKKDDFVVVCNICHKNCPLTIYSHLNYHIEKKHHDKLKNTQEHTMPSSLTTLTKKNMWKYCKKLSDFKAQCMFCENKYIYLNIKTFKLHVIRLHVTIWKYEEDRKLTKWPWMYFKYFNKLYSQCIICDAEVLSTFESTETHLSLHSQKEQENHIVDQWPWKYCAKTDDFMVECQICHKNLSLLIYPHLNSHFKNKHWNKLKNTQKCARTTSSSLTIITKKDVWKYYAKLSDFEAQCMFCEKKYTYLLISHFQEHIKGKHKNIWKYEEKRKLIKWPWMYFMYLNKLYSRCIICNTKILSTSDESIETHLSLHSKKERETHILGQWPWKYCTKTDDFMVKCKSCNKNLSLSIHSHLNSHFKEKHWDKLKTPETHNIADDSSKRVLSLETDTTYYKLILSLKDCYVLLKKCPHNNLYM